MPNGRMVMGALNRWDGSWDGSRRIGLEATEWTEQMINRSGETVLN